MNMNYDLMTWIEYFVGAFACCFGGFFVGKILLEKSIKKIKFYNYGLLIIFSIFVIINSLTFDNIAKIIGILIVLFLIFKLIFDEDYVNSFLYSVITYILFILSEITISIFIVLIEKIFSIDILLGFMRTIFINIIVSILSCIYAYLIRKQVKLFVKTINRNNIFYIFIMGVVIILITLSSMYKLYLNDWIFDYFFLLNIIVILGCIYLWIGYNKLDRKDKDNV